MVLKEVRLMNRFSKRRRGRAAVAGLAALLALAVAAFAASGSASTLGPPKGKCASPSITGTAQEGQTLTAHPGDCNWKGSKTYAFVWQRCDKDGGSCSAIAGATDP